MGRAYSCWMLNCWCVTWPVGFKRFSVEFGPFFSSVGWHQHRVLHFQWRVVLYLYRQAASLWPNDTDTLTTYACHKSTHNLAQEWRRLCLLKENISLHVVKTSLKLDHKNLADLSLSVFCDHKLNISPINMCVFTKTNQILFTNDITVNAQDWLIIKKLFLHIFTNFSLF